MPRSDDAQHFNGLGFDPVPQHRPNIAEKLKRRHEARLKVGSLLADKINSDVQGKLDAALAENIRIRSEFDAFGEAATEGLCKVVVQRNAYRDRIAALEDELSALRSNQL